jgi:hypothetical protein
MQYLGLGLSAHHPRHTPLFCRPWVESKARAEVRKPISITSLQWHKLIFAQTEERANSKPCMLIQDGFGMHETLEH